MPRKDNASNRRTGKQYPACYKPQSRTEVQSLDVKARRSSVPLAGLGLFSLWTGLQTEWVKHE